MSMPPPPQGYPQHQGSPSQQPYGPPQPQQGQPWPPQAPYPQHQGYPQHPQQAPYPPQVPFPQQQGAWGGPPPMPPKKTRNGRILGISAAIVVGVVALGWAGNNLGRLGASGSFPAATHKITLPKTLLDGRYTLTQDHSDKSEAELAGTSKSNIRGAKGVAGQYTSVDKDGTGVLVLSGLYGRIKNPDLARDKMLEGAAEADGATVAVAPKDIEVTGSDVTITCQVLTMEQPGGEKSPFAMCAWADENTSGSIAEVTAKTAAQSPESIDLDAAAANTLKVREETRKPIA
ncbi:hypothetical protein ACWGI8_32410 [Streptomyces sp. NPDC054841]